MFKERLPSRQLSGGLDAQRPDQPQTGLDIGEDAHDLRPALDLFVEPLEQVGALQGLVVRPQ